jgi:hypothetical protein
MKTRYNVQNIEAFNKNCFYLFLFFRKKVIKSKLNTYSQIYSMRVSTIAITRIVFYKQPFYPL